MKTTIDLPDELFIQAKKRAAEERTSLRKLFTRGLQRELSRGEPATTSAQVSSKIRWITVDGGLPPSLDLEDRAAMHDWLGRGQ